MPFENLEEPQETVIIALFSDADLMQPRLERRQLLDVVLRNLSRPSMDIDLSMRGEFADIERRGRALRRRFKTALQSNGYVCF